MVIYGLLIIPIFLHTWPIC